jgi:hypothetical protein
MPIGQTSQVKSRTILPFRFWCQKVLPAVYDDSLSYYELLCKVMDKLNEIIETWNLSIENWEKLYALLEELEKEFEEFKEHGFDDYYAEQVGQWIAENLEWVFKTTVKQVFFGLTQDGYFVAYIPETWDDIIFDTGSVYGVDNYGRLILRWNTSGKSTVDQTRENRMYQNG